MNIEYRYKPPVLKMGFEEFGDKYFRNLSEIDYFDRDIPRNERIYPMAWDNYQDRDLVWNTKKSMIADYIKGVKRFCDNNPINVILLNENIISLSQTERSKEDYKDDIEYFQKFVDRGYKYFIFIGKNRTTLPIFQIWKGIKDGNSSFDIFKEKDVNGEYIYNVEYRIYDRHMDSKWKGEFYRAEKTIFPDSEMMMKISYDCPINKWIYNWVEDEDNRIDFSKTWNDEAFTLAKPKEFIDECMYYQIHKTYLGATSDIKRWKDKEPVPNGFEANWKRFVQFYKYISTYCDGNRSIESIWKTENRMRLAFKTIVDMADLKLKPFNKDPKYWLPIYDRLFEFVHREITNDTSYGWSSRTSLDFNQLIQGLKVSGAIYSNRNKVNKIEGLLQHQILTDIFSEKFFYPLIQDGLVVEVTPRESKSVDAGYSLFFKNGMKVRINGQKESGEWFNTTDETCYKKYTLKDFIQLSANLDHKLTLRSGLGTNDEDNLEWTTSEYNKWKGDSNTIN
jgi:hypothetical protein